LKALNSLARQQSTPTQATADHADHLLDYLHTHPDAIIRFYPSDMILQIHSDASYINEPQARSTAVSHYFLGHMPQDNQPIRLNGAIYSLCTVLKHLAASAAEAELGALFLNTKEAKILHIILDKMGHPQPPTRFIATISRPSGLPTAPSNNSDPAPWKCAIFGSWIESNTNRSVCSGTQGLRT
jgi:hypothetical protein